MQERVNLTISNKALYMALNEMKLRNGLSLSSQVTMDLLNYYYEKHSDLIQEKIKEMENITKEKKKRGK